MSGARLDRMVGEIFQKIARKLLFELGMCDIEENARNFFFFAMWFCHLNYNGCTFQALKNRVV